MPRSVAINGLPHDDTARADAADRAYHPCQFPPKLKKRMRYAYKDAFVWGAELDGTDYAWVGDKRSRRWMSARASVGIAQSKTVTRETLERIAGG